jgi:hypothetical protein
MTRKNGSRRGLRLTVGHAIGILSVVASVGCGSSATSPTPASGSVTALLVSSSASATGSFQLAATARMTDGGTRDVTASAQWETSNRSLATISGKGLVTVVGAGQVEFRATYLGVVGALQLLVSPAPSHDTFALSGVVHEVEPNERSLAGARIDIITGPDAGRFAVSDAAGFYQLTGVSAGSIAVVTTLDGFEPYRIGLSLSANMQADGWLAPVPPTDASGATATARCKDATWSWSHTQTAACSENGGIAYPVCPGPFCRDLTASTGRR